MLALSLVCLNACSGGPGDPTSTTSSPSENNPTNPNDPNAPWSCGVNPTPINGDSANVLADGTVVFKPIPVGTTVAFAIPVRESADTDETIVAMHTSGAFEVLLSGPVYVPRGQTVMIPVSFKPTAVGQTSADLVLSTAKMGNSHVALTGTGL